MIPRKLTLTNFKSFIGFHEFTFPDSPGLYFLTGDNKAEPRLEANGAGKSTLWDALCWVAFGVTARGMRAGDVSNWDVGKTTSVDFQYEHDGSDWILSRCWNPNSWTLFGPDDQALALVSDDPGNLFYHHLGLNLASFLHSVLMAQGQSMFLDMKPPEKEALVAEVLQLDVWLRYSEKASTACSALQTSITELKNSKAELEGQLKENDSQDWSEDIRCWDEELDQRIDSINARIAEKSADRAGLRNNRGELIRRKESLGKQIEVTRMTRAARVSDRDAKRGLVASKEDEVQELSINISTTATQIENLRDGECPHCLQQITTEYRLRQGRLLEERIKGLQSVLRGANSALSRLRSEEEESSDLIHQLDDDIQKLGDTYRTLDRDMAESDQRIKNLDSDLDRLSLELSELRNKANPFRVREKQQSCRGEELTDLIHEKSRKVAGQEEALWCNQYWVRGFKEIRLHLIAEAIYQLELEVNSSVTQLGLMDWKLRFDVDSENKSGKIKKGFAVKVLSPHNKEAVAWESWSGGESQRLRIAAEMGLANLIRSARGIDLPLEVWDEPTTWLSPQGVSDLLDSLAARAQQQQRQVWIVDHRSLGFGSFEGTMIVTKDESGSKFNP